MVAVFRVNLKQQKVFKIVSFLHWPIMRRIAIFWLLFHLAQVRWEHRSYLGLVALPYNGKVAQPCSTRPYRWEDQKREELKSAVIHRGWGVLYTWVSP